MTKICSKCKIEQPVENFSSGGPEGCPDGLQYWCKSCVREYGINYRSGNSTKIKSKKSQYREVNKESISAKKKLDRESRTSEEIESDRAREAEYRRTHEQQIAESKKTWYSKNQERLKTERQQYYADNKEEFSVRSRKYRLSHKEEKNKKEKERRDSDPQYHLASNLRTRFNRAIKQNYKSGSSVRDLGCSVEEFKEYLESKFQLGMTWENYGTGAGKWHIDHIVPLSAFDLTNRQHVVLACYYLNLQPLWMEENLRKYNKTFILPETKLAA